MKKQIIFVLAVVILSAGLAFYLGMKYQQRRQATALTQFNNRQLGGATGMMGRSRQFFGRTNNRPIVGRITSIDNDSLVIKEADGSSRIIFYSDQTVINRTERALKSDLKKDREVFVSGKINPDGSLTAQSILLNPEWRLGQLTITPSKIGN